MSINSVIKTRGKSSRKPQAEETWKERIIGRDWMSEKGGLKQAKNEGGAVGSKRGCVSAWRRLEDATLRWMKRLKNHAEVEEMKRNEQENNAEAKRRSTRWGARWRNWSLEQAAAGDWGVAGLTTRWRDSESPGGEVVMADAVMINWQRWVVPEESSRRSWHGSAKGWAERRWNKMCWNDGSGAKNCNVSLSGSLCEAILRPED